MIEKISINGNPFVGILGFATNRYAVFTQSIVGSTTEKLRQLFDNVFFVDISENSLCGVMATGNSRGILLPYNTGDEREVFKENEIETVVINSKYNAIGNLVVMNDKSAIVSPILGKEVADTIEDILDIETMISTILSNKLVGTLLFVNNKGGIVHPDISEEELSLIEDFFSLEIYRTTICFGTPLVKIGIVGNDKNVVVGDTTTGVETVNIEKALLR